jgi:hypothetical protein
MLADRGLAAGIAAFLATAIALLAQHALAG